MFWNINAYSDDYGQSLAWPMLQRFYVHEYFPRRKLFMANVFTHKNLRLVHQCRSFLLRLWREQASKPLGVVSQSKPIFGSRISLMNICIIRYWVVDTDPIGKGITYHVSKHIPDRVGGLILQFICNIKYQLIPLISLIFVSLSLAMDPNVLSRLVCKSIKYWNISSTAET